MSLGDIYYILFRRKWLILGASLLGFIAAGVVYALLPVKYQSVAELYIGYVVNVKPLDATGPDSSPLVRDPGAMILNSELQILKSLDLAKAVAETEGPASILGTKTAGTNAADVAQAAMVIENNLLAEVSPNSQMIKITFSHENRGLVQPVLDQLITNYIIEHSVIHHRTAEFDSYLRTQIDMRKMRLNNTEDKLAQLKNAEGIVDIGQAKMAFTASEEKLKEENYVAMSELDEAMARANVLSNLLAKTMMDGVSGASTNASMTNQLSPPTESEKEAYNKARQRLADLQAFGEKLQIELGYTTNSSRVKINQLDIEDAEAKKKAMEDAHPALVVSAETRTTGLDPAAAYNNAMWQIAGIQARIARQTNELALIRDRGTNLVQSEVTVHELERDLKEDEGELAQMQRTLDVATTDAEAGPYKVSSISISEQPTPPVLDVKKRNNLVGGIAGGGVALGLALAFLWEMMLDRSFKRPQEVATKLGLPFFLAVPYLNGHGPLRLSERGKAVKLLPASADAAKAGGAEGRVLAPAREGPMAPWDENPAWQPFHETLRDRLIAYFEMANLTHKPKLVALTGCHRGAGVSTLAAGLACSLSETGDGNVLLVNMNSEDGDAHRFYRGKLNLGLEDIFEKEKENRELALVQDKLYVVKESSMREKLPSILPKRFSHLVSKMKASDYDYIIFDMPPVTQTSVTTRLARFMDMVLLVVEAEKTDRDVAQRAASQLSESRANLGVVMNKSRSYVPRLLHQEF